MQACRESRDAGLQEKQGCRLEVSEQHAAIRVLAWALLPRAELLKPTAGEPKETRAPMADAMRRHLESECATQLDDILSVGPTQARAMAAEFVEMAFQASKAEQTFDLPQDYGDRLIADEARDPAARARLASRRQEGVRDEDLRWWWNRHDVQRRLAVVLDAVMKSAAVRFLHEQQKLPEAEVLRRLALLYPDYSDSLDDPNIGVDADAPLPIELKNRVSDYLAREAAGPEGRVPRLLKGKSSLNALLREELRAGKI